MRSAINEALYGRSGEPSGVPGESRTEPHRRGIFEGKEGQGLFAEAGWPAPARRGAAAQAALVRMRGPSRVTATVCSKCAAIEPSAVTTVHLSSRSRVV